MCPGSNKPFRFSAVDEDREEQEYLASHLEPPFRRLVVCLVESISRPRLGTSAGARQRDADARQYERHSGAPVDCADGRGTVSIRQRPSARRSHDPAERALLHFEMRLAAGAGETLMVGIKDGERSDA